MRISKMSAQNVQTSSKVPTMRYFLEDTDGV